MFHFFLSIAIMNYLWILAFCLCGALATPVTEDETQPKEMASELDIIEERDEGIWQPVAGSCKTI